MRRLEVQLLSWAQYYYSYMNRNYRYEKESFCEIIRKSINFKDVTRNLEISGSYGNRKTIKRYIKLYNIDTSHFYTPYPKRKSNINNLMDYLIINSLHTHNSSLKERLYKEGLKKRECELCGQDENWMGKKMSLILDHINGVNDDYRIENLRIVCPNCNGTLPTHGGKNIKNKYNEKKEIIKKKNCTCGNKISLNAKQCKSCSKISKQKTQRPPIDVILNEIKEMGYCAVGRKYGVSDNCIRKWIK
jgi:hypothetical protein